VIGFFIGSYVVPTISSSNVNLENNEISDELDQQQTINNASTCLLGTMLFAQSFEPSFKTLTRVQLYMNKLGNLYGNSILYIRESLTGSDLTSVSKESVEINGDFEWIEFDFPDIQVDPGDSYYIILKPDPDSDGGDGFNYIGWAFGWKDFYTKGGSFYQDDVSWNEGIPGHSSADYTFKTYGINRNDEDEIEIEIYAGQFGIDIGFGISIDVLNHKDEDFRCDVELEYDFIFRDYRDFKYEYNFTVPPENPWSSRQSTGSTGIKHITVTARVVDLVFTRTGISIGKLMIFTN
jgi:hypothetical protein